MFTKRYINAFPMLYVFVFFTTQYFLSSYMVDQPLPDDLFVPQAKASKQLSTKDICSWLKGNKVLICKLLQMFWSAYCLLMTFLFAYC